MGRIPVPPKYMSAGFARKSYWGARCRLDVPKDDSSPTQTPSILQLCGGEGPGLLDF
jgi:hypothetical protein